jgi:hypothetical protein
MMKKRHTTKRAPRHRSHLFEHSEFDPEVMIADRRRLQLLVDELKQRYGTDVVRDMCGVALDGYSKGWVALEEKVKLVRRLLTMPGGANKYRLARTIAEENRRAGQKPSNPKSIERKIDDALVAVRRYQEHAGFFFAVGDADELCEVKGISCIK